MTYFNPIDKYYKSHTGAVCADTEITFRVKGNFNSVVFLLKKDGCDYDERYQMQRNGDCFELTVKFKVGLYFYCFSIDEYKFIGLGQDFCGIITDNPKRYQLTVYAKDYYVPNWIKGGIIYQIFPDRFCSYDKNKKVESDKILHENWSEIPVYEPNEYGQVMNNDFFGGDIKGIISKLDYLHELGVTVIYLNPIFKAYSNHRYDTGDYMSIDPLLGTEKDFQDLIEKANKFGIKIVLDGVFNHTGDDSLYFNKYGKYDSVGAYQSKDSKYFGWYNFINYPDKYDAWWGISVLPAINEANPDYVNYITGENGVLDKYTKMGIGGWRLDVVDELPADFVRKIRNSVKHANPNAVVIGEVWEDASNKIAYGVRREYFQGQELDSVMNYPLKNAIIDFVKTKDVSNLSKTIKEQIDHYPFDVLHSLMNILATHDTYRLLTAVGGVDADGKTKKEMASMKIAQHDLKTAKFRLKVATLLQYTLCGVPSVYYGDEISMEGYADPLNRLTYPWGKEDTEILSWYKRLGKIRRNFTAFNKGEYKEIYSCGGTFAFTRRDKNSELLIAINLEDNPFRLKFKGKLYDLIGEIEHLDGCKMAKNSFAVLINPYKK